MDDKGYQAGDALPDKACGNYEQQPTNDQFLSRRQRRKQSQDSNPVSAFSVGPCLSFRIFRISIRLGLAKFKLRNADNQFSIPSD
jgi:hypothetical protein